MDFRVLPYRHSLALFTDLYQLTMGQVYHAEGMAEWEGVFHYFYRSNPFGGGYTVAGGLELVVDYLNGLRFDRDDLAYLATIPGNDGKPIFRAEYLDYLGRLEFSCDVDAVPEGTVMFPHEPMIRVRGPLVQAQMVETALLTLANYSTAIATEASRICYAAGDIPVIDFSARRAPGIDGALTATRSAYIGGFVGTSNVWAARHLGLPPAAIKGTMAHSLVMSFDTELEAFLAYARTMPNNCLFLVDTYGTIEGVRNAITVGRELRANGFEMLGIRLDSGDLAQLSRRARRMLDQAGFTKAAIVATNDLNEFLIQSLRAQNAAVTVCGVGTKLMVPALSGVYKLAALRQPGGEWESKIKLSDQPIKVSIPGIQQVIRYRKNGLNLADCIYDERTDLSAGGVMVSLKDQTRQTRLPADATSHNLLKPVMRQGRLVAELPTLEQIRQHRTSEMQFVSEATKRFDNPDEYRVGIEKSLFIERDSLMIEQRGISEWEDEAA
ncbi:MAG TPA: nicotinate phosphoribosyltransferase [Blastocatellia bacterium]|nr:nicotinate phosphoribosyltransferase [Blastocatellia bacterium]